MNIKRCDVCNSEEGKPRLVGNYMVELSKCEIDGFIISVCQGCKRKSLKNLETQTQNKMKTTIKQRIKRAIKSIVGIIMFSLTVSIAVNAQGIPGPPGFPTTPTDAPIDGGLSLLAAAGGAYAIKKLRDKNK